MKLVLLVSVLSVKAVIQIRPMILSIKNSKAVSSSLLFGKKKGKISILVPNKKLALDFSKRIVIAL